MAKYKLTNKGFPDEATLKKIRSELSDPNYTGGHQALPPDASELDRTKYDLSQLMIKYIRVHGLQQKELAKKLDIDESRMSDILRGKIQGFTLDRLISYAEILHPGLKIKIIAA